MDTLAGLLTFINLLLKMLIYVGGHIYMMNMRVELAILKVKLSIF